MGGEKPRASVPGAVLTGGAERTASAGGGGGRKEGRERDLSRRFCVAGVLGPAMAASPPTRVVSPALHGRPTWWSNGGTRPGDTCPHPLCLTWPRSSAPWSSTGWDPSPQARIPDRACSTCSPTKATWVPWNGQGRGGRSSARASFALACKWGVGDACQASFLVRNRSWAGTQACR